MENPRLITAVLAAVLLFVQGQAAKAQTRNDPIDVNLIIDGSRYARELGGDMAEWICGYVIDGILTEGDHLRIRVAGDEVRTLYAGVFSGETGESVKNLLREALPGSNTADFAGALGDLFSPAADRPLMTYTLLVSTLRGLSSARQETVSSYLRFSRVMDFPGWRVLVIGPDIGPLAREAAGAFLSGG
jgi:hypothetical protein